MAYIKTTWVNGGPPALSAENLNKIEDELYDLDDGLATVTGKISDFLYVKEMSQSYTCAANTPQAVDFSMTKTGYTLIGVVGYSTGHGSVLLQQARKIDSSTIRVTVRNITGGSISSTAMAYGLFVRTGGGS